VAQACVREGLDAIRPGLGDGFQMRFGYGVGVGYPPTWLDPFEMPTSASSSAARTP
jgi:hypothetical protein